MAKKPKFKRERKSEVLTPQESMQKVRDILKNEKKLLDVRRDFLPGNLIFTKYDAKYPEFTYDRTPLVLVLSSSRNYVLGLNFHWLPVSRRMYLVKYIMDRNKKNIQYGRRIDFSYKELKPMLKSLGYAPCIRLYIKKRIWKQGVVIPPERLPEMAKLRTETFTMGRYSASQIFARARKKAQKKK